MKYLCFLANDNSLIELTKFFQFLFKLDPGSMTGEIGVMFNIPQPYTVRSRRLSQVIRINQHHFKQMVKPYSQDGKAIMSNFTQVCRFIHT
jgi:CRP-like cAMP-binding protein